MFRRGKLPFVSNKDDRIKIFNERINLTEKHVLEIATIFADCARKIAKYRDTYDELAKGIKNYADEEEINESLSDGLKNFTNALTILGDYKDLNVHRLELKIVNELAQFENLCKNTRESLRLAVVARDKEVLKQRQMLEIKTKFAANNSAADSELLKSKLEVNRTNKEIDEILTNFEKRKINDLKSTLKNFILISLKYHTKALEVFSATYFDVDNIDEKGDLMEFQKIMKTKESQQKKSTLKKALRSQSMESLDRDQLLSPIKRTSRMSRSTKNLSAKSDDDLDDEEEDEDEEASDDNTDEEEETGINSEDEDEKASDSVSEAKELDTKLTSKKTSKQHFKAQQQSTTANMHKQEHKPFAAKSPAIQRVSGGGGIGRLVTVVESKKK